jgi:hypothetical protein
VAHKAEEPDRYTMFAEALTPAADLTAIRRLVDEVTALKHPPKESDERARGELWVTNGRADNMSGTSQVPQLILLHHKLFYRPTLCNAQVGRGGRLPDSCSATFEESEVP